MKANKITVKDNYIITKGPGIDAVAVVTYKNGYKETICKSVSANEKIVCIRMPDVVKGEVDVSYFPLEKKREKIPGTAGYPSKLSEYADRTASPAKLPVDTKEHTRAALSYFSKTKLEGASKKTVAERILRAAKKFGIKVSKDSDVYKAAHGS